MRVELQKQLKMHQSSSNPYEAENKLLRKENAELR
jgi:hypothetical protein